jgi:plastocyanin
MMVAFFLAAFTACGGDDPTGPGGGGGGGTTFTVTTNVSLQSSTFTPANIQVSPGATVTFTWNEAVNHNVTFASASITNVATTNTGAHPVTMPGAAGDYTYQCTLHGGMSGTVRVQ